MNSGIYKITNLINGKFLIGQTKNFRIRWNAHKSRLNHNKHGNPHLQSAWNKYGEQNFKFEIVLECPLEKLDEEEKKFIEEFNSMDQDIGYNLISGGGRPIFSQQSRQKMSTSKIGTKHSEETKKKMSDSHKGFNNHFFGKKLTTDHVQKLSQSHIGQKAWNKGKAWSEEIKDKLSKSHIGQKAWNKGKSIFNGSSNPFFGKHHSEETKQKIRDSLTKKL